MSIPVRTVATVAQRTAIPQNEINPNSLALLQYILPPNEAAANGVINQFRRITPVAGNFRQSIFRFDHNFTSNASLMVRYIRDDLERNDPGGNIFVDPFVLTNVAGTLFPNAAAATTMMRGKNQAATCSASL